MKISFNIAVYKIVRNIYHLFLKFLELIFFFLPVSKKKIVFNNFNGKGYGCNPKYIADEILCEKLEYKLVWLVGNTEDTFPNGINKVAFNSIRARIELATAQIIVTNVKNRLYFIKKSKQLFIQTWHGTHGFKYAEREIQDKLNPSYIKQSKITDKYTDIVLSNSKEQTQWFRDNMWSPCEIFETGYPRNDILVMNKNELKQAIRHKLGIVDQKKIILYAPTFRDNGSWDAYNLDFVKLLSVFERNYGSCVILIRLHPNAQNYNTIFNFDDKIIDTSFYPDMQELLLVSDVLITDYSSSVFDFALMGKAIYIFATDIDEFANERGLRPFFYHLPIPICKSTNELIKVIEENTEQKQKRVAQELLNLISNVDKGDASIRVVDRIKTFIESS